MKIKFRKAAPRFELGIKDLQSSALPLGHAASKQKEISSYKNSISLNAKNVLVITNGHGEDLIALRIIECLIQEYPEVNVEAIPLVGDGKILDRLNRLKNFRKVGISRSLPSGGFNNQSLRFLYQDIRKGLFYLLWSNWIYTRKKSLEGFHVIAIGDLLPLFFAYTLSSSFGFIGTPKSDHTWINGPKNSISYLYHLMKGTEWEPWELFLMRSSRCKMIIMRDQLTANSLIKKGVQAKFLGNPMMDGITKVNLLPKVLSNYRRLIILCGSRDPEASRNFEKFLYILQTIFLRNQTVILVPTANTPSIKTLEMILIRYHYKKDQNLDLGIGGHALWRKNNQLIVLGPGMFFDWCSYAEVGLANAGTATEQLAGLGVPSISVPGKGPQFTREFANRQSRLLGGAVKPCQSVSDVINSLENLLENSVLRDKLGSQGIMRMGQEGGSKAIANLIKSTFLSN